jgi:rhamnose utilization protein RhaD (predicted bifunctional aldolase and dehydrogenase)
VDQTGVQDQLLREITELSHSFGTSDYVRAGGGNTSVKTQTTLWVKPSGTTLLGLSPQSFIAMDRARLGTLYTLQTPVESAAREALVKTVMEQAILPGSSGRASVEAPLHDSLEARFVVHTHPALVNGMTCAVKGRDVCHEVFPEALWIDYVDPGYTLCMRVRGEVEQYKKRHGQQPALIFLKNHGVFVAADTPNEVHGLYASIFDRLADRYEKAGVGLRRAVSPLPEAKAVDAARKQIRQAFGSSVAVAVSGRFNHPEGPISPDHIVYSKSYALVGEPTAASIMAYRRRFGYDPQVIAWNGLVCGVAAADKQAALSLELAQDGALVQHLAAAFGGIEYMTEQARLFIENWEVESYRRKQI